MEFDLSQGLLTYADVLVLQELVNKVGKNNFVGCDVGTNKGLSSGAIAFELKKYKNTLLYTIDHWALPRIQRITIDANAIMRTINLSPVTVEGSNLQFSARLEDEYYLNNKEAKAFHNKLETRNIVKFVNDDSTRFAYTLEDKSCDFIFIDADHTYEKFKDDLIAYWPKVKKGGILCGHDYDRKFASSDKVFLNELRRVVCLERDEDCHSVAIEYTGGYHENYQPDKYDNGEEAPFPRVCIHGGIVLALHEVFDDEFSSNSPLYREGYTSVWYKQK